MTLPTRPNVLIATPCYGGMMTHIYVHSLLKLIGAVGKRSFSVGLLTAAHDSLVTRSRNTLVKTFLDNPAATHLMFIDADIGFEPEALSRLLDFDEEVVAGVYPVKVIDWKRVSMFSQAGVTPEMLQQSGLHFVGVACEGEEREERSGFVTGTYAGTGFMMIKRSALERFIAAYPETRYRSMQTFPQAPQEGSPFFNVFDCMVEPETGVYLSEDFTFCHRFRKIGGKVWLDTTSQLRHVGTNEFFGRAEISLRASAAPAAEAAE